MELKFLKTFITIAEEGNFSAAAEKLSYTNSALTFQIDQLEQELAVKLFEKIGRKMVLTEAGRKLVPHAREVFEAVDRLQLIKEELSECEGQLRVGVAETWLCYRLPNALKAFVGKAPKARLYIRSMNCYDIRDALIDGTLDAGVFYADVGGFGNSLTVSPLEKVPVVLVGSPAIAARFHDFKTPGQQFKIPLIINEPNCIFRQIFEDYLKQNDIILDHTIELGSIATIKNLVQNDVGVTFLPRFAVKEELKNGSLTEIPTNVTHNELTIACARHKNKWGSPLLELFLACAGAGAGGKPQS